ncbi:MULTISPECIES: hypothetical protein [Nocardiopsis]|uniref:Secreted protein n=2 Tax=Nocardiopsis TaxID=2013 RepID=A0ABT4TWA4_9ACTN|nr:MULTISPECIES: hypothetical protein [Nocardiopsis]MDA2808957.1 hypothetical protein [Nocardiopsis suaedae]MDA2814906.1 hypothetical protein [Nocardiopsis endophytica]
MKKTFALAALTAAAAGAVLAAAPAASAGDSYALINGDVAPCAVAPWNWEGPVDILTLTGDYNACQKYGITHGG